MDSVFDNLTHLRLISAADAAIGQEFEQGKAVFIQRVEHFQISFAADGVVLRAPQAGDFLHAERLGLHEEAFQFRIAGGISLGSSGSFVVEHRHNALAGRQLGENGSGGDVAQEGEVANEAAAAAAAGVPAPLPQKEECTFDDFMKMDIRTATVLEAVKVPKTDKLLKLTIDTGIDTRTIVSGIAEHYTPEEMVGKQICILANLAPRKIKGIESKGMILMAKDESGRMKFVTPAEAVDNGACVG